MKILAITRTDGGVSIMSVKDGKEDYAIAEWRKCHSGEYVSHRIVTEQLPSDRTYREAWRDNGSIYCDLSRARVIHRDRIRAMREAKFKHWDAVWMKSMAAGDALTANAAEVKRQQLRDAPQDPAIDAATTPEELKLAIPAVLHP